VSIVPSDLFLSATLTADEASAYLAGLGFGDPGTADTRLQALAEDVAVREALARVADVLLEALREAPDPDQALAAFVRHVEGRPAKVSFLESLRADPRALGLLVDVAGRSPFVADLLLRSPELLHWLVPEAGRPAPTRADLALEVGEIAGKDWHPDTREAALCRLHRRELLRIACRDVVGGETLTSISDQLAVLADVTVAELLELAIDRVRDAAGLTGLPGRIALVGLGRLGACELDFTPDLELLFVYEPEADGNDWHARLGDVAYALAEAFRRAAANGDLYSAELTERPAALGGPPAASLARWEAFCAGMSDHRLRLAFTRARFVAGQADLGRRVAATFERYAYESGTAEGPVADARRRLSSGEPSADDDVRGGAGGLDDLDEAVATLRLVHGPKHAAVRTPDTLATIEALAAAGALRASESSALASGYTWLRRVEQRLSLGRGGVPPTLDDPATLDLAAAAFDLPSGDALRERLLVERIAVRSACRSALARA
jgi:glutamate-ammonia-ligase adenylyltransferase